MATASRPLTPPGSIKFHSPTGRPAQKLLFARDLRVPSFFIASYGFAARLTLTQYSGLGGGVNAAFSSFGRRQASLAVSGTTIICCTAPLPLTSMISIVGDGPLAVALQSFTARA